MPIITQFKGGKDEVIPWNHYPTTKEWTPRRRKTRQIDATKPHNGKFEKHRIDLMKVSPEYKKIVLSKHNGKKLENGEIRVGDDLKWNPKTGLIGKYEQ